MKAWDRRRGRARGESFPAAREHELELVSSIRLRYPFPRREACMKTADEKLRRFAECNEKIIGEAWRLFRAGQESKHATTSIALRGQE